MVAVQLDQARERLLDELARAEGAGPEDVARRVLEDYLDFRSLPKDDPAEWAEASIRLTPEILSDENWDEQ
jgi:hypothetical protein